MPYEGLDRLLGVSGANLMTPVPRKRKKKRLLRPAFGSPSAIPGARPLPVPQGAGAPSGLGEAGRFRRYARQAHATGTSRVLVATEVGSDEVVAFYAWSMATVSVTDAPDRSRK